MDQVNSITTWNINNINGLLGLKTEVKVFVKTINSSDIICLQETVSEALLPGFVSFSNLRSTVKGGGVTTLIRNNIAGSSTRIDLTVPPECSLNVVVVKIRDTSKNCNTMLFNVYIPPSNSRRNGSVSDPACNFDFFQDLTNQVKESQHDEVVILGDVNARISNAADYIEDDTSNEFVFNNTTSALEPLTVPNEAPISLQRNSQDSGSNAHKRPFLDLVQSQEMLILNGRTLGDLTGKYTCYFPGTAQPYSLL